MQGDFDGNGVSEILYYGGAFKSSSTNLGWRLLKLNGYTTATNRIKTITDGLGTVKNIEYGLLTNDTVYQKTINKTFPLLTMQTALPVAKRTETIAGTDTLWTSFTYKNAIFHWQGKGFLGFLERTAVSSAGSRTVQENSVNEDYYVLYNNAEKTYPNSDYFLWKKSTKTTIFVPTGSKRYLAYLYNNRTEDNVDGYLDYRKTSYNDYGVLYTSEEGDNCFHAENEPTYWESNNPNIYIKNLPREIVVNSSGGTLNEEETERVVYTRNNTTGQPLTCKKYRDGTLISTELYTYNSCGQVLTHTAIYGSSTDSLKTTYTYNANGALASIIDPMGLSTTYGYNARGQLYYTKDHLNVYTYHTYDNMLREEVVYNNISRVANVYATSNYNNSVYKITRTEKGKPTHITFYDGLGRKVAEAEKRYDARYLYTDYRYGRNGQIEFTSFPHIGSSVSTTGTTNTYDIYNRLVSQTDSNGKTSTWSYQPFTVTSTIDGVARTTQYACRGVVAQIDDDSGYVCFETDAGRRTKSILHHNFQNEASISYDNFGRITQTTDLQGVTRSYTYDANGHPRTDTQGAGTRTTLYDKFGRLQSQTFHDAVDGATDITTYYRYNNKNQLVCDSSANHVWRYEYDTYGRTKKETRTVLANSVETVTYNYTYNANNQLSQKSILLASASTTLNETYTYANGWCTDTKINDTLVWQLKTEDNKGYPQMIRNARDTIQCSYDVYGHLLSQNVHGLNSMFHSYTYDLSTGNLTQRDNHTYAYDDLNQLTGWNNWEYAYDNLGNLTKKPPLTSMQNSGFRLTGATGNNTWSNGIFQHLFTYLPSIRRPLSIVDATQRVAFSYDGEGQRAWMKYFSRQSSASQFTQKGIRYYLAEDCEIDHKFSDHKRYYYYVGGTPYDAPAVVLVEDSVPTIYQIYRDHLGSILMYANASDSRELYYTPYGQRLISDDLYVFYTDLSDELFIRSYTGHEELPYFGLLNANARIYDPLIGRFLCPDPLFMMEGGPLEFNPYIYARNNPLTYVDQDGEFPFLILAAALFGGTMNVVSNWGNISNWKQGLVFFAVGSAAGVGSALGFSMGSAFLLGAGNSILSQGFTNGWKNIQWGQVALAGGSSLATSVLTGIVGNKLNVPITKLTSNISNSVIRETLNGVLGNASTGFLVGTGLSLVTGNDIKTSLRNGANTAASNGIVGGVGGFVKSKAMRKPYQMHHFATIINKNYSPKMGKITEEYGLSLDGDWNKELLPHIGRHPNIYHDFVLYNMQEISKIANGNQNLFLYLFELSVKQPIRNNPDMLYKKYWLNH